MNNTAEYALRAMACLARKGDDALVRSEQLAMSASIPSHYLSKIMRQLVVAGLVEARRGRGGGFRLARPPGEITYAQVLAAVGSEPDMDHCVFGYKECSSLEPCPLHNSWVELRGGYVKWAEEATLEEAMGALPREPCG